MFKAQRANLGYINISECGKFHTTAIADKVYYTFFFFIQNIYYINYYPMLKNNIKFNKLEKYKYLDVRIFDENSKIKSRNFP